MWASQCSRYRGVMCYHIVCIAKKRSVKAKLCGSSPSSWPERTLSALGNTLTSCEVALQFDAAYCHCNQINLRVMWGAHMCTRKKCGISAGARACTHSWYGAQGGDRGHGHDLCARGHTHMHARTCARVRARMDIAAHIKRAQVCSYRAHRTSQEALTQVRKR